MGMPSVPMIITTWVSGTRAEIACEDGARSRSRRSRPLHQRRAAARDARSAPRSRGARAARSSSSAPRAAAPQRRLDLHQARPWRSLAGSRCRSCSYTSTAMSRSALVEVELGQGGREQRLGDGRGLDGRRDGRRGLAAGGAGAEAAAARRPRGSRRRPPTRRGLEAWRHRRPRVAPSARAPTPDGSRRAAACAGGVAAEHHYRHARGVAGGAKRRWRSSGADLLGLIQSAGADGAGARQLVATRHGRRWHRRHDREPPGRSVDRERRRGGVGPGARRRMGRSGFSGSQRPGIGRAAYAADGDRLGRRESARAREGWATRGPARRKRRGPAAGASSACSCVGALNGASRSKLSSTSVGGGGSGASAEERRADRRSCRRRQRSRWDLLRTRRVTLAFRWRRTEPRPRTGGDGRQSETAAVAAAKPGGTVAWVRLRAAAGHGRTVGAVAEPAAPGPSRLPPTESLRLRHHRGRAERLLEGTDLRLQVLVAGGQPLGRAVLEERGPEVAQRPPGTRRGSGWPGCCRAPPAPPSRTPPARRGRSPESRSARPRVMRADG